MLDEQPFKWLGCWLYADELLVINQPFETEQNNDDLDAGLHRKQVGIRALITWGTSDNYTNNELSSEILAMVLRSL